MEEGEDEVERASEEARALAVEGETSRETGVVWMEISKTLEGDACMGGVVLVVVVVGWDEMRAGELGREW